MVIIARRATAPLEWSLVFRVMVYYVFIADIGRTASPSSIMALNSAML